MVLRSGGGLTFGIIMSGKSLALSATTILLLVFAGMCLPEQDDISYRSRGDRSEGIVQPKRSGNSIELISAMADYHEANVTIPPSLAVRFYLKEPTKANVSVRGIRVAQYYWMNEVHPHKNWARGFDNEFRWPTSEVIQKLKEIKTMYDLGVVVCLGANCETTDDLFVTVAPAILYSSSLPNVVAGYQFTFKPIAHENLTFKLYQDLDGTATGAIMDSKSFSDVDPGIPFNVHFDSPKSEGWYQLQVSGVKLYSEEPVSKVIRYYHAPVVAK
jgi:hypothetical protein